MLVLLPPLGNLQLVREEHKDNMDPRFPNPWDHWHPGLPVNLIVDQAFNAYTSAQKKVQSIINAVQIALGSSVLWNESLKIRLTAQLDIAEEIVVMDLELKLQHLCSLDQQKFLEFTNNISNFRDKYRTLILTMKMQLMLVQPSQQAIMQNVPEERPVILKLDYRYMP